MPQPSLFFYLRFLGFMFENWIHTTTNMVRLNIQFKIYLIHLCLFCVFRDNKKHTIVLFTQMKDDVLTIYGKHPVLEKLKGDPATIAKVYVKEGLQKQLLDHVIYLCRSQKVPFSVVPGRKLSELVGRVNDQGLAAELSVVGYAELQDWMNQLDFTTNPTALLLDEITDPNNFGAILRSAVAFDISGVIVPKHHQAPVNAAVFKASAGHADKIPIIRVTNINQAIAEMKDKGFWVAGLDMNGETAVNQVDFNRPMVIVIGSEGSGIRKKTASHCDYLVHIPMNEGVESLNVSASAAIICYERKCRGS